MRSVRRASVACDRHPAARGPPHGLRYDAADRRARTAGERADTREPERDRGRAREPRCECSAVGADPRADRHRDRGFTPQQHFEHAHRLPISVGIRTAHRELYLNRSANLDYFETHVAVIGPRGVTDWVFTTDRRVTDGKAIATVGFPQLHPSLAGRLPLIEVSSHGTRSERDRRFQPLRRSRSMDSRSTRSRCARDVTWGPDARR